MTAWDPWLYTEVHYPDVQVRTRDLPPPLQGCVDHERRIIWIARGLSPVAARCTLAYEVAELEQGPTPADPCLARARQQAATDRAARRLIRLSDMIAAFGTATTIPAIAELLGVDTATMRARLRGLTAQEQDSLMAAIHAGVQTA